MSKKEGSATTPTDEALTVFESQVVRHTLHKDEWWFAIVDVVGALTDSVQPEGYLKDLRKREAGLAEGWGQIASPLRFDTLGVVQ